MSAVPTGFVLAPTRDGAFIHLVGPLYQKPHTDDAGFIYAIRIGHHHLNAVGTAHGGLLLTLADTALGDVLAAHYDPGTKAITVSLSSDFAAPVQRGDWVEAHVDIQRLGGRLGYANCYLKVGEARVFRASGVFSMLRPKKTLL